MTIAGRGMVAWDRHGHQSRFPSGSVIAIDEVECSLGRGNITNFAIRLHFSNFITLVSTIILASTAIKVSIISI